VVLDNIKSVLGKLHDAELVYGGEETKVPETKMDSVGFL
jgi:hypothetical protein